MFKICYLNFMAQSHLKLFDVFLYSSAFSRARVCDIDPFLKAIVFMVESLQIVNEGNFFSTKWKDFALYLIFDIYQEHLTGKLVFHA